VDGRVDRARGDAVDADPIRITEVQAGSYVLLDRFHGDLVPGGFEVAMTVLGTVISRHGNTVVLDCGRKARWSAATARRR
jgi:D-serine deaminase-like pyridoxal phosphate-dependent protein